MGQHARHRAQGGHALGGDQLPLVEVVLERERGAAGEHGDEPRLVAAEGQGAVRAAAAPSTSMPTRPLRAIRGTQHAVPPLPGVSRSSPSGQQVARVSGASRPFVPAEGGACASHLRRMSASKLSEPAVPEQEGRPPDAERGGKASGEEAGESREVGGLQDLVGEAAQRRQRSRALMTRRLTRENRDQL